ncbi:TPA: TolC family protein [Legionella pneumophila]|uniref:Cobalt/zinc/cadmium efflux RND transporter, outer membrane protein n=2 Tax=Legionella pneumophila TaxID=446 RepID=Q5ZWS9_LEGPH|nr:TolC family protein [Legionella pneumophila]AAU27092.1 cobalt/zinc/cadmium efflux RND transporter, outer membrane protein [Legionella pneumophila subsp. pneumophila str. Philadelphia 1]AOU04080.1 cobalt transporter [Legionella pneumophila]AOU07040.1 cobalt transporter [Legionella pneumophila]AOU10043.1 cobalt transporter [Legionella pneumophila]AOU12969.1 cobalt transporter [Legionella pneumophila]
MRIYFYLVIAWMNLMTHEAMASSSFTFKDALAIAYRNNPELQAEIDKAQAMRGYFIQSGLYPNPQLTLTAENFGGSGSYSSYESAETTASVTQPIPLGNRLSYLKKASYADYLASLAQIQVQKAAIYMAVGGAYVDALYAGQWHQVTKKLVSLNEGIVKAIERRVKAGAGAELDLRLAQIRLGESHIQEKKAARDALSQRAKLARLLGIGLRVDQPLVDKGLPDVTLNWSVLLKTLPQSPQLIQMQQQLKAKRATITAVKKSVWPDLNIQLGARHFSDDGSNAAVMSAYAQVPVFDRNQGKIMTAEAQFTQTAHEYQGTKLDIRQTAYTVFLQAQQSHYEAELVTSTLLPLARKSIKLAQDGYQMGRYTYIELSTALNALYEEERHYQQAHADYHKTLIQLTGLLGLHPTKESK